MSYQAIKDLVGYALRTGLIEEYDRTWAVNSLLQAMGLDSWEEPQQVKDRPLEDILKELLDDAAARGILKIHPVLHRFCLKEDGLTARSEP